MSGTAAARDDDQGFGIAELVVAAAILFICVTASISGIMAAGESAQLAERRTEALNIANQEVELARNLAFDDVATIEPSNGLPAGKIPRVQTIGDYTVTTDIAYGTYGASVAARYKTISADVSWKAPVEGDVAVSSLIAGASGTQDYNFGSVSLAVVDEGSPAKPVSGVVVWLTDVNSQTYSVVTTASGIAQFNYVPSGNITFSPLMGGSVIDAVSSPACIANTTTAYGPVTVHPLRTGSVRCLSPAGAPVAGVSVGLSAGPSVVASVQTNASGDAVFPSELIKGTYTVGVAHAYYQSTTATYLTVGTGNANVSASLSVKAASVTATRSTKGTIYVWNAAGTLNTSLSSSASSPYSAVFSLTNPDILPRVYYFTKANVFATTNGATVTPGQSCSVTVN